MTRSVCLKKLKALLAQADESLYDAVIHFNDDNTSVNEAREALAHALQELGVVDDDPNGVPCECLECRPAKDVSRG